MNDDTTDSTILKIKLVIDAKYFLSRSRSRLIDSMNTIESICLEINSIDDSIDDLINDSINDSIDNSINEIDNSTLT